MSKEEFFILCLTSKIVTYKAFLLHLFSIKKKNEFSYKNEIGSITGDGKKIKLFIGENEYTAGWWKPGNALFGTKEEIIVQAGEIPNIKQKTKSTYGRLLLNQLLLVENLYNKIDYQDGNWHSDDIIYKVMDTVAKDDSITAEEAHNFINATQFIVGLTQLCVPSASEKALTTDPRIKKRRNELLKQYEGKLNDSATIAKIEQELITMDREWIKGDISEGFYKSKKSFNISRKKAHVMHGGEANFLDESKMTLVPTSLQEGWDMDYLPEMVNSLRDGSYSRGAATAIGGERVKKFQQVFQNASISIEDCKTKLGLVYDVTNENKLFMVGRRLISGDLITNETADKYVGKKITLRSPLFCNAVKTDFCAYCSGESVSKHPNAINMLAASIGSVFMLREMAKTHGKELITIKFPLIDLLS